VSESESGGGGESEGKGRSADERRGAAAERCRERRERALLDGRCGRCFKRRPAPGSDLVTCDRCLARERERKAARRSTQPRKLRGGRRVPPAPSRPQSVTTALSGDQRTVSSCTPTN
jgi:hypothetical protein